MIKRRNRLALAAMRDVAVVWSSEFDGKSVHLFDTVKLTGVQANDYHFHAIDKMQHRWHMLLIVMGVKPCGEQYVKQELHVLTAPRFHTATVEYFNEQHQRLLNSINPNHERHAAWIATPFEREFTDAEISKIIGI